MQALTLSPDCVAVIVAATTGTAYCVWDGSTPSATNSLRIIAGQQPVFVPLGAHAGGGGQLKMVGSVANTKLDLLQLS